MKYCHFALNRYLIFSNFLTRREKWIEFLITKQTDDAEIKAATPIQRTCDAENQAGNEPSNGPRRAHSKALCRVFCDVKAYVSCRGYEGIPLSAWSKAMNQGGTANKEFVPDRSNFCQGFLFPDRREIRKGCNHDQRSYCQDRQQG